MKPWYLRWPKLLEEEEQLLQQAGMHVERDHHAFEHGIARLIVRPQRPKLPDELIVTFPDAFPYFRFEIQAPALALGKHQNPYLKNLCLIGRSTDLWTRGVPEENTVLAMIENQVPKVLAANDPDLPEHEKPREEPQGEPVTDYLACTPGAVFLDGRWRIPGYAMSGTLDVGIRRIEPYHDSILFQAAVLAIHDETENRLCFASDAVKQLFRKSILKASWTRGKPPRSEDVKALHKHIQDALPGRGHVARINDAKVQMLGLLIHEEVSADSYADGWMFSVQITGDIFSQSEGGQRLKRKRRRKGKRR